MRGQRLGLVSGQPLLQTASDLLLRFDVVLQPFDRRRQLLRQHGQLADGAATPSRSVGSAASARPPQTNSRRLPPLNRSHAVAAMMPMAPVRDTCVPPHADRSNPSTSISRSVPPRAGSFRSGSAAASSLGHEPDRAPARSSQTMRLASCSAARDLRRRHVARRDRWSTTSAPR